MKKSIISSYFSERKYIIPVAILFALVALFLRLFFYPYMSATLHTFFFFVMLLVFMIIWEFILLLGKFLEKYLPVERNLNVRGILQIIITFTFSIFLQLLVFNWLEPLFEVVEVVYIAEVDILTPAFTLFRSIVFNLVYFGGFYFKEWKRNLLRSERLQREQAEVRYNALRNQLNPHFLFNALTSLNSLIFENQQLASDFLKQLAKVYRYTLQNRNNEVVSLKKEIEFVEYYISLLKTRFGDAIEFLIKIDDKSLEKSIVPVTTQMMIENAIKHNVISLQRPLRVVFEIEDEFLIIQNNVNRKLQIETSNRLGLENLKALYNYLSPLPIQVIEKEDFFTIKIPLI